jgi:hypothetical protein
VPFSWAQVRLLGLMASYEFRDDPTSLHAYDGIVVQWHMYNQDSRPHYTATAAMPAGVWVIDVTGGPAVGRSGECVCACVCMYGVGALEKGA